MVLGLSLGELALVLGAAVAVFGPKDIPIIARALGRMSGKAVAHIRMARGQLDEIMQRTQVDQVHKDLQETMAQLEAIRHEIKTGMSILQPGPITREVLDPKVKDLFTQQGAKEQQKSHIDQIGLVGNVQMSTTEERMGHNSSQRLEPSVNMSKEPDIGVPQSSEATTRQAVASLAGDKELFVLPVSAAMAGLLSSKKGSMTGSSLVLESLEEQRVASQAREFLQQAETLTPDKHS